METNRRTFLAATGTAFATVLAGSCVLRSRTGAASASPYTALLADPQGLLDLPEGFSYRVISRLGDAMDDGGTVPDRADGMGCFELADGRIALVRNHELEADHDAGGTLSSGFDHSAKGEVLPGGTTTVVLNAQTLVVERQFRSLAGTIRNCAGGVTPWGSWLTCEEDVSRNGEGVGRNHGWIFEVPANADGLVPAHPLREMGRFRREAAAVDPVSGIVYMTEDRDDSLLYRFIPVSPGRLAQGGRLQALAIDGLADSRNWERRVIEPSAWFSAHWVDLDDPESAADDLRHRGVSAGALLFARGEGIHMGDGELYFCCTSGGAARLGQIFRLKPNVEGPDQLQLFFESTSSDLFNRGDNLTIAANGHLVVCEDQYAAIVDNHVRVVTPDGDAYPLARLHSQTEIAGACFSPDGQTLFVNAFSPAVTFAIRGPWKARN